MGQSTAIEWTDATWNPIRARVKADAAAIAKQKGYASLVHIAGKMAGHVGPHCEHASRGCDNCYAETNNHRCLPANGTGLPFDRRSRDLVDIFIDETILQQPFRWKKPKRIFPMNQSDLFGEWVRAKMIDKLFAVMSQSPQHTFQVLTKRADVLLSYITDERTPDGIDEAAQQFGWCHSNIEGRWPLPNVWLGVSVEDQKTADERIPLLLQTPAAIRFISYEPALVPVDFSTWLRMPCGVWPNNLTGHACPACRDWKPPLHWIIAGGESGSGARPAHPDWFRAVRDQCFDASVPFFFKQWGEYAPASQVCTNKPVQITRAITRDGRVSDFNREDMIKAAPDVTQWEGLRRLGKKAAGCLLDEQEYKQFPVVARDTGA